MRIAFLTTEFVSEPYFAGGLANYLGRVTRALAARGHSVEVFVISDRRGRTDCEGVLVHRVPLRRHILRVAYPGRPRLSTNDLPAVQNFLATAHSLDRAFRQRSAELPFDVVEATSLGASGLFVARRWDTPVVTRASTYAPWYRRAMGQPESTDLLLADRLEMAAMRLSDGCYAPSHLTADLLVREQRIPAVVVEPPYLPLNGPVDTSAADGLGTLTPYLLFFSAFERHKGADVLAAALPDLLTRHPDLRVVLAGRNGAGSELVSLEKAFPGRVVYLGVLRASQLQPVVQRATAILMPSRVDNLPNACLESMAASRVVIGTRGASFEQLIEDGQSGFLVPIGDVAGLQRAISQVWQMGEGERTRIGAAARQRVDQLSPEVTLPRLLDFYAAAVERHQSRGPAGARERQLEWQLECLGTALAEREMELVAVSDLLGRLQSGRVMRLLNAVSGHPLIRALRQHSGRRQQ